MSQRVFCVFKTDALLGEAPVWSQKDKALYWLDILKEEMHRFYPKTGINETLNIGQMVTSLALLRTGKLILTLRDSIAIFDPAEKTIEKIAAPEKMTPENRFNDGKCDRKGRFWCASMNAQDMHKETGSLYRVDTDRTVHRVEDHVVLGNGMGWSPNNRIFYFTQTLRHTIYAYDFDLETGSVSNKRTFVKLESITTGGPDGLTVDAEGFVWSAHYGTGRVIRYSPQGEVDRVIQLPVLRVTSCAFGGEQLDMLYITTAREHASQEELKNYPLSGSIFAIQPGVKGLLEPFYEG